ncbi:hypothetical protein LEP1GSC083_0545 [Leptospira interrogans serovar Pyrogenes str. L0374]|nr:hypothetical protein LEP1GSC067_4031 [Leptospira interrogans serovar Lora str. TE 1992]EMF72962.1 hypothetical protein LEP1GSC148_1889 [Leptospira interrogans serovar Canicola str. LT1962]EMG20268.1 hypothetical protein LEP1GSC150_2835 [Leptospira interrogans serovar Copenhageni str. LT2050]EMM96875.1 hypothetical protein LEP1GSC158_3611 [Leptospira interrogans serovar Zanoni str. LT2156]EMN30474.1 hypothetical protein LEP1GSC083_0545 [Leptospira interrogans serovar Pyrogenes str. L0374]EMP
MDSKERAETIREGNRAFNEGNIRKARDLFIKAEYKDGLIRLGDHFMYEKKCPYSPTVIIKRQVIKNESMKFSKE